MFDFPDAPTANQTVSTPEGVQYIWTGSKWTMAVTPVVDYLTQAEGDALYVNLAGDQMSGTLAINTGILNLGPAAAPNTANITATPGSMVYLSSGNVGHFWLEQGLAAVPLMHINEGGLVLSVGYLQGIGALGNLTLGGGPFIYMDQDQTVFTLGGGLTGGQGGTTDAVVFRWLGWQTEELMILDHAGALTLNGLLIVSENNIIFGPTGANSVIYFSGGIYGPAIQAGPDAMTFRMGANNVGFAFTENAGLPIMTLSPESGLDPVNLKLNGWQYLDMSAKTADAVLVFNRQAGRRATIQSQTLGVTRWIMNLGDITAETGAGAGSNFLLVGCNDVGTANINAALEIERITNAASFGGTLTINSGILNLGVNAGFAKNPGAGQMSYYSGGLIGHYFYDTSANPNAFVWINSAGIANAMGYYHGIGSVGAVPTGGGPFVFMDQDQTVFALGGGLAGGGGTTDATAFRWQGYVLNHIMTVSNAGELRLGTATATTLVANGGFTVLAGTDGYSQILLSNALWAQLSYRTNTHYFNSQDGVTSFATFAANGTFNVSGVWGVISEASQKQNIAPYTAGLEAIRGLNPVTFEYIAGSPFFKGATPSGPQIGLIAEDVEPLLPELVGELTVSTDEEGVTQTVATLTPGNTIYAMINAIKEIADRLTALEGGGVAREAPTAPVAPTPQPAAQRAPAPSQRPAPPPPRRTPPPRR